MSAPLDPTFRKYNAQQAAAYAHHRGSGDASLTPILQKVLAQHAQRDGEFDFLVDAGCGTGQTTTPLALHFSRATGCDPGAEMIAQARQKDSQTKSGQAVTFEVLEAERLGESNTISQGTVDLLTASMAAHWFHMDRFWEQAARIVKPGGTVALWTMSSLYCRRDPSTPNAPAVQAALSHLEDVVLAPYELPQNRLSREMYEHLKLPWHVDRKASAAFPESLFTRHEWNRDGKFEPGEEDFFGGSDLQPLADLAAGLGTASMVTRWREDHPRLVGTPGDCVAEAMGNVAEAYRGNGPRVGEVTLKLGCATTLLIFTRSREA